MGVMENVRKCELVVIDPCEIEILEINPNQNEKVLKDQNENCKIWRKELSKNFYYLPLELMFDKIVKLGQG